MNDLKRLQKVSRKIEERNHNGNLHTLRWRELAKPNSKASLILNLKMNTLNQTSK